MMPRIVRALLHTAVAVCCAAGPGIAAGQSGEYTLDASGQWTGQNTAAPGTDQWTINEARRALAEDRPQEARSSLDAWIEANARTDSPHLAEAYLLRGDALVALDDEFQALYDYEFVAKKFRETEFFPLAVRRELDIALRYANGLKLRSLGFRWADASEIAEELLMLVQERLPGSALAEEAAIELADYYYRRRDMALAREAYDLYLANFPKGANRIRAQERRIQTDIARFKGPNYSAASLINARLQIQEFLARYPADADRTGLNEAMIARIDESMAAQLLDTAAWYVRTGDAPSARFTLKRLLRDYPATVAAQRAETLMEERGWNPPSPAPPATPPEASPTAAPDAEESAASQEAAR